MLKKRMLVLAEGSLDVFSAKTAVGLIRYRPGEVVGVLDGERAGEDLEKIVGCGRGIPIVSSVRDAAPLKADTFVIGIAPPGGRLPPEWQDHINAALCAGMDLVSGLHTFLGDVPEFAALAKENAVNIWDVRKPPRDFNVGTAKAVNTTARRVLTVGTDCNIGKKVAALELVEELRKRSVNAEFIPTGQTGIMIAGWGVAIDAVKSDFVSGASEWMVLEKGNADVLVVEGQGSLLSPSYSAVTLGLMHGVLPHDMILCHAPDRNAVRHQSVPILPLPDQIRLHEEIMAPLFPSKVVAVALNCFSMSDTEAEEAVRSAEESTGLPATECIRFGAEKLADVVLERMKEDGTESQ